MNERIFELAKQADLIQWDTLPSGARTPDHESVVKAKKFAEMIVRECIEVMNTTAKKAEENNTYMGDDVPTSVHQYTIKQHFGVKL